MIDLGVQAKRDRRLPPLPVGTPIEVRVEKVSQLFNTLDPFPFNERDLDKDAEDYIVGWARELPPKQPITIRIHLPEQDTGSSEALGMPDALANYFGYRTDIASRDLNELFRVGRQSLVIGLTALTICLIASRFAAAQLAGTAFGRIVEESLIIVGWVANWKPIQIFLYDWWPLVRRRNLYRRLNTANIEIQPYRA